MILMDFYLLPEADSAPQIRFKTILQYPGGRTMPPSMYHLPQIPDPPAGYCTAEKPGIAPILANIAPLYKF